MRDKESRLAGTDTESMKTTALLFGLDLDYVSLTLPRIPCAEEAEKITALAELCSENFADYNAERMVRLIKKRMSNGEIFVIVHKNNIAGFIMFSKKNKTIAANILKNLRRYPNESLQAKQQENLHELQTL